jgi:rare lipoprotein A
VRVTNKRNGQSVKVTITDRGPFVRGRVIDLTPAAAKAIGMNGTASVSVSKE